MEKNESGKGKVVGPATVSMILGDYATTRRRQEPLHQEVHPAVIAVQRGRACTPASGGRGHRLEVVAAVV